APGIDVRRLVAQGELREGRIQVTLVDRCVLRLGCLGEHVDDVERLRETYEVAKVGDRACALTALQVTHARRPRDRRKHYVLTADETGARGVTRYEADFGGYARECLTHQARVESHHLARLLDACARGGEHRPPAWRKHAHPLALEDAERREMHALDVIVGEDPYRREGIDQVAVAQRALGVSACGSLSISPARSRVHRYTGGARRKRPRPQ